MADVLRVLDGETVDVAVADTVPLPLAVRLLLSVADAEALVVGENEPVAVGDGVRDAVAVAVSLRVTVVVTDTVLDGVSVSDPDGETESFDLVRSRLTVPEALVMDNVAMSEAVPDGEVVAVGEPDGDRLREAVTDADTDRVPEGVCVTDRLADCDRTGGESEPDSDGVLELDGSLDGVKDCDAVIERVGENRLAVSVSVSV